MKAIISIPLFFFTSAVLHAEEPSFDQAQITVKQQQISAQLKIDYPNFNVSDDSVKSVQYNAMLMQIANSVLAKQWADSSGSDFPLVDWDKVDEIDSFFKDQIKFLESPNSIAQTNDEAARIFLAASLNIHYSSLGKKWYRSWLLVNAKSTNENLKRLTYWFSGDLGNDFGRENPDEKVIVDWLIWKQEYDTSNKLGKAVLLRSMTGLAKLTDQWDKLREIHLSIFNGSDDELKAVALAKGDRGLGDVVMAKWTDLAQNSTNAKLKSLAQQAIARHNPEDNE